MIKKHIKRDHIHTLGVYFFVVIFTIILSFFTKVKEPIGRFDLVNSNKEKKQQENQPSIFYKKEIFDNLKIKANAYVIYDINEKRVIAGNHEQEILPLASISKIMMAITAMSLVDKNTAITINKNNTKNGYDLGLKKNQSWRLDELLKYTLVFSSNDGAEAVADNLGGHDSFVEQMNTKASEFNLKMNFTDPAGLDIGNKIGGVGSALDVAKMMAEAHKIMPDILDSTTHARASVLSSNGPISGVPNTNQEINEFLGVQASKTGFTDKAGGNLALIVDITVGHPVVIVVLGSTKNERFSDALSLYNALKESLYGAQ